MAITPKQEERLAIEHTAFYVHHLSVLIGTTHHLPASYKSDLEAMIAMMKNRVLGEVETKLLPDRKSAVKEFLKKKKRVFDDVYENKVTPK